MSITETIKHLRFWHGLTFGTVDAERVADAVDAMAENIARSAFGDEADPALLVPPSLEKTDDAEVTVGPWVGWSLRNPAYQVGSIAIDVSEATYGDLQGPVAATTPTYKRNVYILARYKTVQVGEVVDNNLQPDYAELHHGIEYEVMMSPEFDPGGDDKPTDLADAFAAGFILLATMKVGTGAVDVSDLLPSLQHYSIAGGNIQRHLYWLNRILRNGCIVKVDPATGAVDNNPPSIEHNQVDLELTLSLDTSVPWGAMLGRRIITSDHISDLEVTETMAVDTDYFLYLEMYDGNGSIYPRLSVYTSAQTEGDTKIQVGTFTTDGSGVAGDFTATGPGLFALNRDGAYVNQSDTRLRTRWMLPLLQDVSTTVGGLPLTPSHKGAAFELADMQGYSELRLRVAAHYAGAGNLELEVDLWDFNTGAALNGVVCELEFSGAGYAVQSPTISDPATNLPDSGAHILGIRVRNVSGVSPPGGDAITIIGAWLIAA